MEPPIWRRIQVPDTYSFWDLHVALQDAMGWLDYHLHVFRVAGPDEGARFSRSASRTMTPSRATSRSLPGWEIPITRHFARPGTVVQYEYDFGDGWEHELTLEAIQPRQPGQKYPLCVDGARACPPEDCGGVVRLREPPDRDPGPHPRGVREHPPSGSVVDSIPSAFDPKRVKFDDPARRYRARVRGASRAGPAGTSRDDARSHARQAVRNTG